MKQKRLHSTTIHRQCGAVLVEFSVVIALFIASSLLVVDFATFFQTKIQIISLNNSIALGTMKLCLNGDTLSDRKKCMEGTGDLDSEGTPNDLEDQIEKLLTDTLKDFSNKGTFVLSLYEKVSGSVSRQGHLTIGSGGDSSKINPTSPPQALIDQVEDQGTIFIAELFYRKPPATPGGRVLGIVFPENMYVASIY